VKQSRSHQQMRETNRFAKDRRRWVCVVCGEVCQFSLRVLVDWVRRYPATLPELSPLFDYDAEHVAETGWKI
jgi:hypothetical protein